MLHLCFATSTNTKGKHDGDYFVSEAKLYAKYYRSIGDEAYVYKIPAKNRTYKDRREDVLSIVRTHPLANRFAFFCHGSAKYLYGAGLSIWTAEVLVREIQETEIRIAL